MSPTVLVSDMGDGHFFLEGWRNELSAYLSPVDAVPVRCELAFDSAELALRNDQGEVG